METRVERDEDAKHEPVENKPPLKPDLKILESQVLRGPNFWSYDPAIRLLVDLGSLEHWPSNTVPLFNDALIDLLPGLQDHGCSLHRPGGFIERLRDGTWMGHVAEHVALELRPAPTTWSTATAKNRLGWRPASSPSGCSITWCRPTPPSTSSRNWKAWCCWPTRRPSAPRPRRFSTRPPGGTSPTSGSTSSPLFSLARASTSSGSAPP